MPVRVGWLMWRCLRPVACAAPPRAATAPASAGWWSCSTTRGPSASCLLHRLDASTALALGRRCGPCVIPDTRTPAPLPQPQPHRQLQGTPPPPTPPSGEAAAEDELVPGATFLRRRHERALAAVAAAAASGESLSAEVQRFLDRWQLLEAFMAATPLTAPPNMHSDAQLAAGPATEREVRWGGALPSC